MPSKYQYVHELWLEQSQHITSSPESWMTFLKTASWTYKYRFEDQILIYSQKPNARACADFDTWNQKMNRWIKKNTKGIALLNEKDMVFVMYLILVIHEVQQINHYTFGISKKNTILNLLR